MTRMTRIGDHWLADFTSAHYLAFDLDDEILDAAPCSTEAVEQRLIELLGCEDALVMSTTADVVPRLAASRGATVLRWRSEDADDLDRLLHASGRGSKLVCIEGVNAMTGNVPDLRAFAAVARAHGALLYIDDAHGFGVLGERLPRETCAYGMRGNGLVKHANETYDNIVLAGSFANAYASPGAFVACPTAVKDRLTVGRSPVTSLAGLEVNEQRGDELRARLCAHTVRVLDAIDAAGVHTSNRSGFPIIELPIRDHTRFAEVGQFLFDRGILVTPAAEAGFRAQITAAHTEDEIFMLTETIEELAERGVLVGVGVRPRG